MSERVRGDGDSDAHRGTTVELLAVLLGLAVQFVGLCGSWRGSVASTHCSGR